VDRLCRPYSGEVARGWARDSRMVERGLCGRRGHDSSEPDGSRGRVTAQNACSMFLEVEAYLVGSGGGFGLGWSWVEGQAWQPAVGVLPSFARCFAMAWRISADLGCTGCFGAAC
jgi:hypothetical protein